MASFDIQKIKNPEIEGEQYQQGEQSGFWNVREYVLFRDGHKCRHCFGKTRNKVLTVHHIESRQTGGDAPNNLITLCVTCHDAHHKGEIELKVKRGQSFRDAAFMGIMRWSLYERLKAQYADVSLTYGYMTKAARIKAGLPKGHANDAFCILGNMDARRSELLYVQRFVRKNNRSLHKANLLKGGRRKANKAPRLVLGFRLFDKVKFENQERFIFGRRASGYFLLGRVDGTKVHASANHKKLLLLEAGRTLLTQSEKRPGGKQL